MSDRTKEMLKSLSTKGDYWLQLGPSATAVTMKGCEVEIVYGERSGETVVYITDPKNKLELVVIVNAAHFTFHKSPPIDDAHRQRIERVRATGALPPPSQWKSIAQKLRDQRLKGV